MNHPDLTWLLWVGGFVILETIGLITKRNGDTLSERTRQWFRTNTRVGASIFGVSWVVFAVWFLVHILWGWTRAGRAKVRGE